MERVDLVTVPAGAKTILVMYEANNDPGYWIGNYTLLKYVNNHCTIFRTPILDW